eukprot:CAMPEP_0180661300 /NCGR_PEP_ID=MMETSP1037_2-20121125/58747_1 /TAXON_ID=632150 /ORGANISM="Azadinium spinosum, Strain 3D9" /LENGTH=141 /DNA_ID=CAMNT_0022688811 /DNA_START=176 /DNA_END=601 /DNA_ORIENTATION=+
MRPLCKPFARFNKLLALFAPSSSDREMAIFESVGLGLLELKRSAPWGPAASGAVERCSSMERCILRASCFHIASKTFPLRHTVNRKVGTEKLVTKDSHEDTNSDNIPAKNKANCEMKNKIVRSKMKRRTHLEFPATHTNTS